MRLAPLYIRRMPYRDARLAELIGHANEAIQSHNELVRDLSASRSTLKGQVWRFIVEERKTDLATYDTTTNGISKGIQGLERAIASKSTKRTQLDTRLKELEAAATSVKPTVDAIDAILTSFGFISFALSVAGDRGDMYRIARPDGSDARSTLSEGKRAFVTFLYLYHMLAGGTSGTGTPHTRIRLWRKQGHRFWGSGAYLLASLAPLSQFDFGNAKIGAMFGPEIQNLLRIVVIVAGMVAIELPGSTDLRRAVDRHDAGAFDESDKLPRGKRPADEAEHENSVARPIVEDQKAVGFLHIGDEPSAKSTTAEGLV